MRPDTGNLARRVTQYLGIGLKVTSCPEGVGHWLSISLLFRIIIGDLLLMTAARNVGSACLRIPFPIKNFRSVIPDEFAKLYKLYFVTKKLNFM